MKIQQIYRWHLVRLYRPEQLSAKVRENYIEISIHPFQMRHHPLEDFLKVFLDEDSNQQFHDQYNYWDLSDKNALAGTVRQKAIVKYLFDLPALNKTLKQDHIPIRRNSHLLNDFQVEEDMVFLQLCTEQRRFNSLFSSLKKRTGIHNIDPILTLSQSMLIDFTQQSRRMASRIYQEVMET